MPNTKTDRPAGARDGEAAIPAPAARPRYEPPRVLKKRSVSNVTLASTPMPGPAGSPFPGSG